MDNWKALTVGDVCQTISETYRGNDDRVVLINTSDVLEGKVLNHQSVENKDLRGQFKKTFRKNDILYSEIRPANKRYAFIDFENTGNYIASTKLMVLRPDTSIVHPKYLFAFLTSSDMLAEMQHLAESRSGTFPQITFSTELAPTPIQIPAFETQVKIVGIIDTIERKIDDNKSINENLEQQAFCLFRSLMQTPHPDEIQLSSIADINPRRTLSKGDIARCIDMAQLPTVGSFPNGWEMKPYNGGMRFCNGDTLLARITPCLENGKTAFIDFLDEDEVAFGSTEYIVLSTKGLYVPEYFYCLARYPEFVDYAVKNMNGSSGRQRVSGDTVGNFTLPALSEEEIRQFGEIVPQLFTMIRENSLENIRLSNILDALLPRLMTGELDVSCLDL